MEITGPQLRAARALLDIDQVPLAEVAKVSPATIRNWERSGTSRAYPSTLKCVREELERRGVEFLEGNGVRLSK